MIGAVISHVPLFMLLSVAVMLACLASLIWSSETRFLVAVGLLGFVDPARRAGFGGLFSYGDLPIQAVAGVGLLLLPSWRAAPVNALMDGCGEAKPRLIVDPRLVLISPAALLAWVLFSSVVNMNGLAGVLPWLVGVLILTMFSRTIAAQDLALKAVTVVQASLAASMLIEAIWLFTGRGVLTASSVNAGRFAGSMGDYELLSEVCGLAIIFTTWLFLQSKRTLIRAYCLVVLLLSVQVLLATESRSALLLIVPSTALVILSQRMAAIHRIWRATIVALAATCAIMYAGAIIPPDFYMRLRLINENFGSGPLRTLNRDTVWPDFVAQPEFARELLLAGNGFTYDYDSIGTYPHSLYLYMLYTGGIIGLVLFCQVVIQAVRRGWKSSSHAKSMLLIAVAYSLINEIKIEFTRLPATTILFFLILALLVLLGNANKSPGELVSNADPRSNTFKSMAEITRDTRG